MRVKNEKDYAMQTLMKKIRNDISIWDKVDFRPKKLMETEKDII